MSKALFLHSPHAKGQHVLQLQSLLKAHGYYHAALDSEFGVLTSQAVYRAKFWLGVRKPNHIAGPDLFSLLEGHTQQTRAMKIRAALRKRRALKKLASVRLVAEAKKHLGVKEVPAGSNEVLFSKWYGMVGSWCAMFVSYCAAKVGYKQFQAGVRYAYVPYVVDDARAGRHGLVLVHYSNVRAGDLVCYDWDRDGTADHIGIFEKKESTSQFVAIEGNTAVGNDSNGGEVMERKDRYVSEVLAFVRITN